MIVILVMAFANANSADILIIGAGVIGLSIARELRKKGVGKITLVERGRAGREASHAAAGMLAPQSEADRMDDFFDFCSKSRDLYPEFAAELAEETGVDIELDRNGTLYLGFTDEDVDEMRRRFDWQRSAGLAVERLTAKECASLEPSIAENVREALYFPNDWQVENRKLIEALIEFARRNEIEIVENAPIETLSITGNKIMCAESADGRSFSADRFVLATGAWTSFIKIGELPSGVEVKPIRGQMICFAQRERLFRRVIYSPRGYIVPRVDGRVLAGATAEDAGFDAVTTSEGIDALCNAAFEIAPGLSQLDIAEQWAGLRPFAADGLPVIGRIQQAENLFIATAHYRNGILLAPLTGKLVADAIVEDHISSFLTSFSPRRFHAVGSGQ